MSLPNLVNEKALWGRGFKYIVGIDEVGRGSWAGPLVAAGVILSPDFNIPDGLNDSKALKAPLRIDFAKYIHKNATAVYITQISHEKINSLGISKSTQMAFSQIINRINPMPNFTLVDAFKINSLNDKKQSAIIKGDTISASIASASIIAKVFRDKLMENFAKLYPNYGFEKHKGYGTKFHQESIRSKGFSKIHRTSFNLAYLIK